MATPSAMTFCLIDDEREICDLLRLFLESRGHRCVVAHDGGKGLELIRTHRPAAVFLDLQMPVMNGYEVLNALRADPIIGRTPVLLMTALTKGSDATTTEWAKSSGADYFLNKPFDFDQLLSAVETLTGVRI